ncbi:MAG: sensor histidine kinase [Lachnospiraceae bacterium]|nr:sensor histidine kinase [Lachnospiraceae bacterium]
MKNKVPQWLQRFTVYGKLGSKLMCIYFLLIVLPLGMFSFYAYLRVREMVQKQTFSAAQTAFDDTCVSLERLLGRLDGVIDILSTDPLIYMMASNDPRDYSYIHRLEDSAQLATTFEHLCMLADVDLIRLYVNNDYSYSNTMTNIIQISEVVHSEWYQTAVKGSGRLWCAPADFADAPEEPRQSCFSSVQVIYNPNNVKEPLAFLRADIDAGRVEQLVGGTSITENGVLLLLRGDQILLSSDAQSFMTHPGSLVEQVQNLPKGTWETVQAEGREYYARCEKIGPSGWLIVSILPHRDVFRLSREMSLEMFLIVVFISLAAYLLAYLISQSTLKRIAQLTGTMHAVETGNVTVRLTPSGSDEIAQLMAGFNQMMDRVDALMKEREESGRQIKSLELKALQAQINPHFLYNSLDLINCTAISRNVPEISRMVNSLGQFYRLSLSSGREVISLSEEIKHAKLYVEIQNLRFENKVSAEWDTDPSGDCCQIIKIVLQPLIENAILHGIFEKPSKSGRLKVTSRRSADGIRITVEDDGMGMDEATVRACFSKGAAPVHPVTSSGYGIRNIQERLRLAYGAPYGLSCVSRPGRGTVVTVHIPAVTL